MTTQCPMSKQPTGLDRTVNGSYVYHPCTSNVGKCRGATGHGGAAHCPECGKVASITSTGKWTSHQRAS